MHRVITCLVVALVPLWAANAQPLKPNTPSILYWTPEQQREGYRSIETIYKTATIARGEAVRALGNADRTLRRVGPDVEDVSAQPCGPHRRDGLHCRLSTFGCCSSW